jgi:hypothetical protein
LEWVTSLGDFTGHRARQFRVQFALFKSFRDVFLIEITGPIQIPNVMGAGDHEEPLNSVRQILSGLAVGDLLEYLS